MNKQKITMARDFLDCLESGEEGWFWDDKPEKAVKGELGGISYNGLVDVVFNFRNRSNHDNFSKTKPPIPDKPITLTINSCGDCPLFVDGEWCPYVEKGIYDAQREIHPDCPLRTKK